MNTLPPNTQTLQDAVNILSDILDPYVNQNILHVVTEENATIYFSENRFPTDILNTGAECSDTLQGDPDILSEIAKLEAQDFKFNLIVRKVDDETGFTVDMHQDFKLVITFTL